MSDSSLPAHLLLIDAHRLRRNANTQLINQAQERFERRKNLFFNINYPQQLTIASFVDDIKKAWQQNQVIIIQSETGSGKSTQLPKIALELGLQEYGCVGITQPRRLATQTLATRLKQELFVRPGEVVGWQIRHHDHTHPDHLLKIMTDGVLLQEIHHDKLLRRYTCLILDEAHERSLNIDLILGYLKKILPQRPDLKIAIVSATLSVHAFKKLFPQAYFLELPGRSFPIHDYFLEDESLSKLQRACWAIDRALTLRGDLLMFCPTEAEIFWYADQLKQQYPELELLPLYARLPQAQQQKIFTPSKKRRLILSTNIAETSLTIPQIGIVIDIGEHKVACYNPSLKVMTYPILPIAQSSIKQRRGRCGRTFEGHCFHLYTQDDAESRPLEDKPQIQRSSLTQVILKILSLSVPVETFDFITPPEPAALKEALQVLLLLGLIDKKHILTALGRKVATYPLDPRFCLMLIKAIELKCAYPVLIIIAFLSSDDPRLRPLDHRAAADKKHAAYLDRRSDFMTILSLWLSLVTQQQQLSRRQFQEYCQHHYLSPMHVRSWQENVKQLMDIFHVRQEELSLQSLEYSFLQIHRALLAGLYDRVFMKQKDQGYLGPRMVKAKIHPGAACLREKPDWIMVMNVEQTKEVFLRWVAPVELHVLAEYAAHAMVYKPSEPYYDDKLQEVFVQIKGTLWGLPIVAGRRALLRLEHPEQARQFFIEGWFSREEGEMFEHLPQWRKAYNIAKALSERARHPSALKGAHEIVQGALEYWPKEILSGSTLQQYQKLVPNVSPEFFLRYSVGLTVEDVPDQIIVDNLCIDITYCCDQTQPDDGVTFLIPEKLWLRYHPMAWLMLLPLYRRNIIQAFLHELPKKQRQDLGNLDDVLAFVLSEYKWPAPVTTFLSQILRQYYDCYVDVHSLHIDRLPAYLRPCLIVDDGQIWRDFGRLQADLFKLSSNTQELHSHDWVVELKRAYDSGLMIAPISPFYDKLVPYQNYFAWNAALIRACADFALEKLQKETTKQHWQQLKLKKSPYGTLYRQLAAKFSFLPQIDAIASLRDLEHSIMQRQRSIAEYTSWLNFFEQSVDPYLNGLPHFKTFIFQQASDVILSQDFLIQLSEPLIKRLPVWTSCLKELSIKEKTKPQLCERFILEWQDFLKQGRLHGASDEHRSLVWSLFFEWAIAALMQPHRPIVPISLKKSLEYCVKSEGFKKSWL